MGNINRKILYIIIGITFTGGIFTAAYAGANPLITLAGDVIIDGELTVNDIARIPHIQGSIAEFDDAHSSNFLVDQDLNVNGDLKVDNEFGEYEFVVDSINNRVGIGTATPTSKLHVVGDLTLQSDIICTDCIDSADIAPDAVGSAEIVDGSVTGADIANGVSLSGSVSIDGNTLSVDSANNRVGIGTLSPERVLHVKGAILSEQPPDFNADSFVMKRPGPPSPDNIRYVLSHRNNNQDMWIYGYDGTQFKNFMKLDYPDNTVSFPVDGSSLTIDNDNNRVGIGTTTPAAKLDVNGVVKATGIRDALTVFEGNVLTCSGDCSNSLTLISATNSFCSLTLVQFSDIDSAFEDARCSVSISGGNWVLRASSDDDADAICAASCVRWD